MLIYDTLISCNFTRVTYPKVRKMNFKASVLFELSLRFFSPLLENNLNEVNLQETRDNVYKKKNYINIFNINLIN